MTRKGFTLIELLIVIAIIGILASILLVSLGGARSAARDARRIADLRQVQASLELYYNKCGKYPGPASGACDTTTVTVPANWTDFSGAITNAGIGVNSIPNDPQSSAAYQYGVESTGQHYALAATLERANQALDRDIDNGDPILNGITIECGTAGTTDLAYCVSN